MEVKIGLTHKCEILAEGVEDSLEYVRIGNQLKTLLDPYYADTFDPTALKTKVDEILAPCYDYAGEVVFIEFLTGEDIESKNTLIITENEFNKYKYKLPKDGLYVYYKVAIQKKEYIGQDYTKKIYYDNGKIMLSETEIKDPSELINYLTQTGMGILDYCEEPVFSLCCLEHCAFNVQKEILKKQVGNCGIDCEKNLVLKDQRNFLFISLYVLQHLISEEKYDEAEEILKRISSCGSLCNHVQKPINDCNCY